MGMSVKCWAAIALAGVVGGRAYAADTQVEVAPAPIHAIPDEADGAAPAAVPADRPVEGPAPAAPSASVAIARRIVDAAGAFDGYMRRASGIRSDFDGGASVARAVSAGAAYEPKQLEAGAVAYTALVALQDPLFVRVVSNVGQDPSERAGFIDRLLQDPNTVLQAPAARAEAARVADVLGRVGGRLLSSGALVKQAAYDVQHEPWSKQPVLAPEARLTRVKAQSSLSYAMAPTDTAKLMSSVTGWRKAAGSAQGGYTPTPVVTQGLALAALAVLGAAGEEHVEQVAPLLSDATTAQCMKMAKLNLYQCLSVAGPHYEDVYCLGRHAMMETGQCVVAAAGLTSDAAPVAEDRPVLAQQSVLVPVALASTSGPERESVLGGQAATPAMVEAPAGPAPESDARPVSPYDAAPER